LFELQEKFPTPSSDAWVANNAAAVVASQHHPILQALAMSHRPGAQHRDMLPILEEDTYGFWMDFSRRPGGAGRATIWQGGAELAGSTRGLVV